MWDFRGASLGLWVVLEQLGSCKLKSHWDRLLFVRMRVIVRKKNIIWETCLIRKNFGKRDDKYVIKSGGFRWLARVRVLGKFDT